MRGLLPDRSPGIRTLLLAADVVLTRAERLWVELVGGWRRRREGRHLNPATGRTSVEHLHRGRLGHEMWPQLQDAHDDGARVEELTAALDTATTETSDEVVAALRRRAPQMLRDHRALQRGMQRRMRALWGPAFDAFYEVYVCVEELGSDLQQLHGDEDNLLIQALLALHARTCLVLAEVHALMNQGFPLGAWARTRTLHETAVLATLLSEHGREPGTEDLGERFLLHAVVDQARDLELAKASGVDVEDEELARVRDQRSAVVARYGSMFAKDYGWSRPLFPSLRSRESVTFDRLEKLADVGLDRVDYRLGGHHVHSSAWTMTLTCLSRGGKAYRLTGPTNVGFGEPAGVALKAALFSMSAIVHGVEPLPDPMDVVALRAFETLSLRAAELFAECQVVVDNREARLQRRSARPRWPVVLLRKVTRSRRDDGSTTSKRPASRRGEA